MGYIRKQINNKMGQSEKEKNVECWAEKNKSQKGTHQMMMHF